MFVRKKRNKSGSVSIQIIDKTNGYRVVRTVGSSMHPDDIEKLWREGQRVIQSASTEQQPLFSVKTEATHTMYELAYALPDSQESKRTILRMDAEQQILHDAIHG